MAINALPYYADWIELLERTKNMDLLSNPETVWIEAFHTGRIIALQEAKGLATETAGPVDQEPASAPPLSS